MGLMASPINTEDIQQIGRFPVIRFIAGGGQAWVFEVEDPKRFHDHYALKLLRQEAATETDLKRFEAEIRNQTLIKHPNLIRVHEWGQDEASGCLFYVMDLMKLGTLADLQVVLTRDPEATVTSEPIADVAQICKYFVGALSALSRIHADGLIHRDIKPQNIFLDETGLALLGDLGIAKRADDPALTQQGFAPGTVLYMSPEQTMGEDVGPESDLFAMGLALYQVLTGRTIYEDTDGVDSSNANAIVRHLWTLQKNTEEFDFEFPQGVPESLREVIRRGCKIHPEDRYRTADEMGAALSDVVGGIEFGSAETVSRDTRRRRWPIVVGVVGTLAVGALLGQEQLRSYLGLPGMAAEMNEPLRALRAEAEQARSSAVRAGVPDDSLRVADDQRDFALDKLLGGSFEEAESGFVGAAELYRAAQTAYETLTVQLQAAEAALASAEGAESEASNARGSGADFEGSLTQGRAELASARARFEETKYTEVPGLTARAEEQFRQAARIGDAQRARRAADLRVGEAKRSGLGERLWAGEQARAARAYEEGRWETVSAEYARLSTRINNLLAQAQSPIAERADASRERDRARGRGADPNDLREGDSQRDLGSQALQRGDFDEARIRFGRSVADYGRVPILVAAVEPRPSVREPQPSVGGLDREILDALEGYRVAYEQKRMRTLKTVWKMSPSQESDVKLMWDSCNPLRVAVSNVRISPAEDGKQAVVRFVQQESGDCGLFSSFEPSAYLAELGKRSDGSWYISTRRKDTAVRR